MQRGVAGNSPLRAAFRREIEIGNLTAKSEIRKSDEILRNPKSEIRKSEIRKSGNPEIRKSGNRKSGNRKSEIRVPRR